jgi:hypothetical protein
MVLMPRAMTYTERVQTSVDPEVRARLETKASALGLDVGSYVRTLIYRGSYVRTFIYRDVNEVQGYTRPAAVGPAWAPRAVEHAAEEPTAIEGRTRKVKNRHNWYSGAEAILGAVGVHEKT